MLYHNFIKKYLAPIVYLQAGVQATTTTAHQEVQVQMR